MRPIWCGILLFLLAPAEALQAWGNGKGFVPSDNGDQRSNSSSGSSMPAETAGPGLIAGACGSRSLPTVKALPVSFCAICAVGACTTHQPVSYLRCC